MRLRRHDQIVAGGRQRLLDAPWRRAREREAREAAARRYEAELATAGFMRRLVLRAKVRLEVRRERETLAPRQGLYFRHAWRNFMVVSS